MHRVTTVTGVLAVTCLLASRAQAQSADTTSPNPTRLALAHQVLDASGAVAAMLSATRATLPAQKQANPQVPAEFWTRFEARITQEAPQLGDSIAVLYARRFTQDELKGMLAFYESPIGRRLVELLPGLVQESAAIGQRWGMRIGAEVGASLLQKPQ
jgi:uncharacterized protein